MTEQQEAEAIAFVVMQRLVAVCNGHAMTAPAWHGKRGGFDSVCINCLFGHALAALKEDGELALIADFVDQECPRDGRSIELERRDQS